MDKFAHYTITFLHSDGSHVVSGHRSTKRAALNWSKWLRLQSYVIATFVYEGPAGGNLIELHEVTWRKNQLAGVKGRLTHRPTPDSVRVGSVKFG